MTVATDTETAATRGSGQRPVAIAIDHVSKRFGGGTAAVVALDDVSVRALEGEFVCLVGPSGCGKSTLLNFVAGLDQPTNGSVATPGGRATLMFQDAALFSWLTVAENI